MNSKKTKKGDRHWYDYLWIASMTYLILGFFNIMFAWLGLICFLVPLAISIVTGSKLYCNRYCGRGQLFSILGSKLHLSPGRPVPRWMKSKAFRYGFLIFFAFGFYSVMLTSTILGLATMVLFRPRSWCVYCPMGTMTQMICKARAAGSSGSTEPDTRDMGSIL